MRRLSWIGSSIAILVTLTGLARAETMFFARLTGNQEVPAVPTAASGTATFVVTPNGLEYSVAVDGLSGPVTAAHIHLGAAGQNGPVERTISFSGNGANGLWAIADIPPFGAQALEALNRGLYYINVHTGANPGGEIRGQILPGTGLHLCAGLDGNQENPPVPGGGSGTAAMILTEEGLRYFITVQGLTGAPTAAHIHSGDIGANGAVLANLSLTGNGFIPRSSLTTAQLRQIITGATYVNVHTAANPGGEIRGQLLLNGATGFTADLDGAQEVPPNGTPGRGTAVLSLTPVGLRFDITVDGLSGPITGAHFHRAPAGANGGVVRDILAEFAGGTSASGVWRADDASPLTPALIADLLNGGIYVNVHTGAFPGGEIRGQVILQPGMMATTFGARLAGVQEEPPNGTTGRGTGYVTLTGAGGLTLNYRVTVSGLTGAITAAHIHSGAIGVNGGVLGNLAFVGTTAVGNAAIAAADQTALINGGLYMNIHTGANPGGEIRGQIVPASGTAFDALLTSAQEVPPNGSAGQATACFRLSRDGLAFRFTSAGLTGAITAAHFHGAERGANGGVARGLGAGEVNATSGLGVWKPSDPSPLTPAQVLNLYGDRIYLNLHTAANPGGEARGQVDLAGGLGRGAAVSGANEVPPTNSSGVGALAAVLTSQGMLFRTSASDLSGAFAAAHFHNAPAGANGPVVRDLTPQFTGLTGEGVWTALDASALTPVLEGEYLQERIYFNLHTSAFPGGEIRGNFGTVYQPSEVSPADPSTSLSLHPSPNPASDLCFVRFALPRTSAVSLRVFDLSGRQVATVVNRRMEAGAHGVPFDTSRLPNGVYFYRLTADGAEVTSKALVVR